MGSIPTMGMLWHVPSTPFGVIVCCLRCLVHMPNASGLPGGFGSELLHSSISG